MKGWIQARRDVAAASHDMQEALSGAEDALVIHWRGFMNTAAEVLHEQQGNADITVEKDTATQPATPARSAAQPAEKGNATQPASPAGSAAQPALLHLHELNKRSAPIGVWSVVVRKARLEEYGCKWGGSTDIWQDVLLPPRFDAEPECLLHGPDAVREEARGHLQFCPGEEF